VPCQRDDITKERERKLPPPDWLKWERGCECVINHFSKIHNTSTPEGISSESLRNRSTVVVSRGISSVAAQKDITTNSFYDRYCITKDTLLKTKKKSAVAPQNFNSESNNFNAEQNDKGSSSNKYTPWTPCTKCGSSEIGEQRRRTNTSQVIVEEWRECKSECPPPMFTEKRYKMDPLTMEILDVLEPGVFAENEPFPETLSMNFQSIKKDNFILADLSGKRLVMDCSPNRSIWLYPVLYKFNGVELNSTSITSKGFSNRTIITYDGKLIIDPVTDDDHGSYTAFSGPWPWYGSRANNQLCVYNVQQTP